MAHPNEDLIRDAYAAYARADIDVLRQDFLAADVRWHFPGSSPLARHHQGADSVAGLFGLLGQLSDGTHRLELHDVLGNDDHVVALHTARAERTGRNLEINAVQVCADAPAAPGAAAAARAPGCRGACPPRNYSFGPMP